MPRKATTAALPDPEGITPEEAIAKARDFLSRGKEGKAELEAELQVGLVAHALIERERGLKPPDAGRYTEGNARNSRKQFKDAAELILDVIIDTPD